MGIPGFLGPVGERVCFFLEKYSIIFIIKNRNKNLPGSGSVETNRKGGDLVYLLKFFSILLIFWVLSACAPQEEEAAKKKRDFALPVQIGKVVYMDVVDQIRAVGNIQAEQRVTVNAEVDGQVRRIFVEEGQRVRRGDLIARIDSREYQLELDRLRTDLRAAEEEYRKAQKGLRPEEKEKLEARVEADKSSLDLALKEKARIEKLVQEKVLAQADLDEVRDKVKRARENLRASRAALAAGMKDREEDISRKKAAVDGLRKQIEKAELELSKVDIRAPFDGVVLAKEIEQGAYADSGNPIVKMVGSARLKAVLEVPQGYKDKLAHLEGGEFLVKELGLQFKHGQNLRHLVRVIPDADIYSGNIKVQIDLPEPNPALFPGVTLESKLSFGVRRDVLHVPAVALVISEQGTLVYIMKDKQAHRVPVKAKKEREGYVEIDDFTNQLGPEVDLILRGSGAVFPGARVFPTNPQPETDTPFSAAAKDGEKEKTPLKSPET